MFDAPVGALRGGHSVALVAACVAIGISRRRWSVAIDRLLAGTGAGAGATPHRRAAIRPQRIKLTFQLAHSGVVAACHVVFAALRRRRPVVAACHVAFAALRRRRWLVVAAPVDFRVTRRRSTFGTARWRHAAAFGLATHVVACDAPGWRPLEFARGRHATAFGLAAQIVARSRPRWAPFKLARRRRAVRKLRGAGRRRRAGKTLSLALTRGEVRHGTGGGRR